MANTILKVVEVDTERWIAAISRLESFAIADDNPQSFEPIINLARQLQFNLGCMDYTPTAYESQIWLAPIGAKEYLRVVVEFDADTSMFSLWIYDDQDPEIKMTSLTTWPEQAVEPQVVAYCRDVREELRYRRFLAQSRRRR